MVKTNKGGLYKRVFKRPMDIILSLLALIVLSPVFLVVAILVRTKLGNPILFKQERPGLNEEIFEMYKFRAMTDERDSKGDLMPDSARLTDFGRFLRSTSMDELPGLLNVLKGDMSIVGPRPQLVRDMVFMTTKQRERHSVMPGLTGWGQVNGRNSVTWEEKLSFDLEYIDQISLLMDCMIILKTISKVYKRDGISAEGMDTAEDFGKYLLREEKISKEEFLFRIEESKLLLQNSSFYKKKKSPL